MNCPCDQTVFPPTVAIYAGLTRLPRQMATFVEFRQSMLEAIRGKAPLSNWRARSGGDFGLMIFEMASYVWDCIAFYDEVIADESYLRTAQLRPSVRRLVDLLGYLPRPGVAAQVDLALFADGRQPVLVPAGTGFRSGAFPGSPPQVFELEADTKIHPFTNKWTLLADRPLSIDGGKHIATLYLHYLRLDRKTAKLKKGDLVLFRIGGTMPSIQARVLTAVSDFPARDGVTYKKIEWDMAFPVAGSTPPPDITIQKPAQKASLTTFNNNGGNPPIKDWGAQTVIHLDTLYPDIKPGQQIILDKSGELRWFTVSALLMETLVVAPGQTTSILGPAPPGAVIGSVTSPPVTTIATGLSLDTLINDPTRKLSWMPDWGSADAQSILVHYGFKDAGHVVMPAWTTLQSGDPLNLQKPYDVPADRKSPRAFLLEDKNNVGVELTGSVDYTNAVLNLDQASPLPAPFIVPVHLFGNVVTATRGETVPLVMLGIGDASVVNQSFKLKKKPLTYLPAPTDNNDAGVASTLKVYVDGVRWTEVHSFFGVAADAQAYIVRQNDEQDSLVTFGDGIRAARLGTGSQVMATYRQGASKLAPPAGSIHQLARPVQGLTTVRNPVAAFGGDDPEPASGLRTYAPRSALLLGRAISIPDFEAAAANVSGVRAVRVAWRWNRQRQRPVVQVWYIGSGSLAKTISQRLHGLSDPTTPIDVQHALGLTRSLSITIDWDPRRMESEVLAAVRIALMDRDTGLLAPEHVGIGQALFRSRIFDAVLSVTGASAVTGLLWNGSNFSNWGIDPGAGHYFDFENGTLLLNGKAGANE